jgi:hypothetical protein
VAAHGPGEAHPAARELLGDGGVAGSRDADLPPGLWDRETEDPQLLHLLDQLLGIGVAVVELLRHRSDLSIDEVADDLDDRRLLRAELELLEVQHADSQARKRGREKSCSLHRALTTPTCPSRRRAIS